MFFTDETRVLTDLRRAINAAYRQDEDRVVAERLCQATLSQESLQRIKDTAKALVVAVLAERTNRKGLNAFLRQYDLKRVSP